MYVSPDCCADYITILNASNAIYGYIHNVVHWDTMWHHVIHKLNTSPGSCKHVWPRGQESRSLQERPGHRKAVSGLQKTDPDVLLHGQAFFLQKPTLRVHAFQLWLNQSWFQSTVPISNKFCLLILFLKLSMDADDIFNTPNIVYLFLNKINIPLNSAFN